MTPSVGAIVHYVSHGTPVRPDGSQEYASECRAAIVTEIEKDPKNSVGLCVLNPAGQFFNRAVPHDEGSGTPGDPECPGAPHRGPHRYCTCGWTEPHRAGGTWHWPERTPE